MENIFPCKLDINEIIDTHKDAMSQSLSRLMGHIEPRRIEPRHIVPRRIEPICNDLRRNESMDKVLKQAKFINDCKYINCEIKSTLKILLCRITQEIPERQGSTGDHDDIE